MSDEIDQSLDEEALLVLMQNVIPRLSETPGKLRTPAPNLGEHTRSILESICYDVARLAALTADGITKEG